MLQKKKKLHVQFISDDPSSLEKKPASTLPSWGFGGENSPCVFSSCPLCMALLFILSDQSDQVTKPSECPSHLCIPQLSESQKELLRVEFTLPERWQTEGGRGREHRRPADPFFNLPLWTPFFPLWVSHRPEARLTLPLRYKESKVDVSCFFQNKHSTNSTGRQLAKLSL